MDVVFSADRLFALHFSHVSQEDDDLRNPDNEVDYTGFGFGWRGGIAVTPFDVPRLSFDIFVIDQLSVGGSISYATYNGDIDPGDEEVDYSAFLFAPRVGYLWNLSEVFGFWLRGGVTYHSSDAEARGRFFAADSDEHGFAFTVEPVFTISPVEHFAFVAGGFFDIDFTGESDRGNFDRDRRYRSFGLQFGLLGWF
jgi:hypothetical protein